MTYQPVGITRLDTVPGHYRRAEWSRPLGQGDELFGRACAALENWQVHEGAGLAVDADGPPAIGCVVAMSAPLPLGYIDAVCRVVDVVHTADRFGFTYGTLSVHPEQGEESFTVTRRDDGQVMFKIVAVSRPHQLLAKIMAPLGRRLQRVATDRYLQAMATAVGD